MTVDIIALYKNNRAVPAFRLHRKGIPFNYSRSLYQTLHNYFAYISLGLMVSTYQIYLYPEHPIYMIQNGTLMAISQLAYEAATTADETQQTMLRIVRIAEDGLHVGDNQNTNNEVRIDSEAVNVVTGGQMESKFTGSYIQFGAYQLRRTADNGLAFKVKEG